MCLYCEAYENESDDEDDQTQREQGPSNHQEVQRSNGILDRIRSSVSNLF